MSEQNNNKMPIHMKGVRVMGIPEENPHIVFHPPKQYTMGRGDWGPDDELEIKKETQPGDFVQKQSTHQKKE